MEIFHFSSSEVENPQERRDAKKWQSSEKWHIVVKNRESFKQQNADEVLQSDV